LEREVDWPIPSSELMKKAKQTKSDVDSSSIKKSGKTATARRILADLLPEEFGVWGATEQKTGIRVSKGQNSVQTQFLPSRRDPGGDQSPQ